MNHHEHLQLRDPGSIPARGVLEQVLGASFAAYETLQEALPGLDMEQAWQWYTPYKAWFAKGQHFWTTQRGTRKEKTLYWLYVYEGYFSIAVWFKEKNRAALLNAAISTHTKQLVRDAETMGKMPTFPVIFDITAADPLTEVYALIRCKKELEK